MAHFSAYSFVTNPGDSEHSSLSQDKSKKQWSSQRVFLKFRRLPVLLQFFLVAVLIYVTSWGVSTFFVSKRIGSGGIVDSAIVILGGGVAIDGSVPKHTEIRIDEAVRLYRSLDGKARLFPLSGGTPYKPNPVDAKGFPIWEATAAARALLQRSIPANRIFEESFSLDTIGNAYWLRTVHIHPGKYRDVYVITNDWHMARTQSIFTTVFSLPDIDPRKMDPSHKSTEEFESVDYYLPHRWLYSALYYVMSSLDLDTAMTESVRLHFVPVAAGIDDLSILEARKQKEAKSLASFTSTVAPKWRTLYDLHVWLFSEHNAYSAQRLIPKDSSESKASTADELLLKTY